MCQNFWPMFIGSVMHRRRRGIDGAQDRQRAAVAVCGADRRHRHGSAPSRCANTNGAPRSLTFEQAKHWEPRYAIGAMVYASVLGVWCFLTIFGNDDAVAHMICVAGDGRLHRRRRGPQLRPAQADPVSHPAGLRPDVAGAGDCTADFYLHRPARRCWRCSSSASRASTSACTRIFVKALTSSFREAALAGQFDTALNNMPHGLCMFRADGRLAVMNHRFSEMMNLSDDLVQRGASAADIIAACVTLGSISAASGKMILSEIVNTQAQRHRSRPIPTSRGTGRCHGPSSRWPGAARSCCSKTSPNAATRKPGSAIWRATTN